MRWGYVARNAAGVVEPPAVPQPEPRWPSGDEVRRLIEAARDDRLQAPWSLAGHTGMRLGELLGLGCDAVDPAAGVLHVHRIVVDVKGRTPTFGEPKTKRSRRTVPLSDDALAALMAHHARQVEQRLALGEDCGPYRLVFATHVGTPLQRKVVREQFKRALKRAGLPRSIRFHDLRHAAATLMLASGIDSPTVAAILGHSQNSTTLNIYAHAVPSRLSAATNALQQAIHGTAGTVAAG